MVSVAESTQEQLTAQEQANWIKKTYEAVLAVAATLITRTRSQPQCQRPSETREDPAPSRHHTAKEKFTRKFSKKRMSPQPLHQCLLEWLFTSLYSWLCLWGGGSWISGRPLKLGAADILSAPCFSVSVVQGVPSSQSQRSAPRPQRCSPLTHWNQTFMKMRVIDIMGLFPILILWNRQSIKPNHQTSCE